MFEGVRGDFMLPQEWSFAPVFKGQAAILERSSIFPTLNERRSLLKLV